MYKTFYREGPIPGSILGSSPPADGVAMYEYPAMLDAFFLVATNIANTSGRFFDSSCSSSSSMSASLPVMLRSSAPFFPVEAEVAVFDFDVLSLSAEIGTGFFSTTMLSR